MSRADLYLGVSAGTLELLSPYSRKFKISNIELSRKGRTADGKLVKDIIAAKKEFSLSYDMIDDSELEKYIDLYAEDSELILRDSRADGYTDYTVLMDPIDYERIIASEDGLWGNVQITLSEV